MRANPLPTVPSNALQVPALRAMSMPVNVAQVEDGRETATVLLVDDQPIIGMVVSKMLSEDPSIHFHLCTDATAALGMARQLRPTVILQDLVMPGADGLELLMAYRSMAETRNIPIIMLSSNDEPGMKKAAFTMGANDYMVKPPEPIELVARIRYHSGAYLAMIQRDNAHRALRVSQQRLLESNQELRRLTNADSLTGLANRRYFNEYISDMWAQSQSHGSALSVLMIDVDYFKSYNDRLGHLAGDDALQRVATVVAQACEGRPGLAARFGGEEFSLVLPGMPLCDAQVMADDLRRRVEALALTHPTPTAACLTVSVGVATQVATARTVPADLIAAADARLYRAKCDGRNRVIAH